MKRTEHQNPISRMKARSFLERVNGGFLFLVFAPFTIKYALHFNSTKAIAAFAVCAVFAVCGALLICTGWKKKLLLLKFYRYQAFLAGDPERSVVRLAEFLGKPFENIEKELAVMFAKGFFAGAVYNAGRRQVVYPEPVEKSEPEIK